MSRPVVRSSRTLLAALTASVLVIAGCSSAPATAPPPSQAIAPVTPTPSSMFDEATPSPSPASSPAALPGEPNPLLTPGATNPSVTQATIGSTICVSGWTATVRPPSSYTTALKRQQIVAYGYADTSLADYEEDHLISLELGGAPSDPANLWPEPYTVSLADGRPVGARVKDQLENTLHGLVCSGQLPLGTAQSEIAHDWIGTWFQLTGQAPPPSGTVAPEPPPPATLSPSASLAPGTTTFVQITRLTSPVARGQYATAAAATVPGASCRIEVVYKSGPSSASGLGDKTASSSGLVSWTWRVGTRTTTGTWPVTVTCSVGDSTASATRTFQVT